MAVIQSYYEGAERNVGPSVLPDFLARWFATRKSMNEEAEAREPNAEDLAALELKAREELGRLQRALVEARAGERKDANSLARTVLEVEGRDRVSQRQASADVARQRLWLTGEFFKQAEKEAEKLADKIEIKDETAKKLGGIPAKEATVLDNDSESVNAAAVRVEEAVRRLAQEERAGGPTSAKYDKMVVDIHKSLIEAGKPNLARAVAKRLLPEAGADTPAGFFLKVHSPLTYDEALKRADEEGRKYGAGAQGSAWDSLARMGILPEDLRDGGTETMTRTETRGAGAGGVPGGGRGGSVSVAGAGPGVGAFTAAVQSGEDPYAALQEAIKAQLEYADSLAAQRQAAQQRRSAFPRANPYLATPNTFVNERGVNAAFKVAENDPGQNRERASAFLRNDGNLARAYAETGQVEAEFAPGDYRPENFEDGGDLGSWFAEAVGEPVEVDGSGGYRYRIDPDLTVTIIGSPNKKGVGTKVERGTDAYNAVLGEVGKAHPLYTMATQPAEVQALFGEALAYARAGKTKEAAKAAKDVSADEVRAAYGMALKRSARNPAEMERVTAAVSALPADVGGAWSKAYTDAVDRFASVRQRGGRLAETELMGSVEQLGDALMGSVETGERRKGAEKRETAEAKADAAMRDAYQRGRELGIESWAKVKDDPDGAAKLQGGLESAYKVAPSDMTKGALDAVDAALKGDAESVYKQRTKSLPMTTTYDLKESETFNVGGEIGGESANARDWTDQGDPDFDDFLTTRQKKGSK